MSQEDPDDYFLPLEDQRVFGAGIRRKRVKFVPAKETSAGGSILDSSLRAASAPPQEQISAGDRYLSIVLGHGRNEGAAPGGTRATYEAQGPTEVTRQTSPISTRSSPGPISNIEESVISREGGVQPLTGPSKNYGEIHASNHAGAAVVCEVCNRSIPDMSVSSIRKHEATFVHQVSLPHSHPPSSIDRTRTGYKYLESHGWNPDSRLGLGSAGQGIREPLKTRVKKDTVGLGIDVEKLKKEGKAVQKKEKKLNAKEVRQMEESGKKKSKKLRRMFYASDDIEKYLGNSEG
ncbi:G-patch domain containing protein [Ascosphaera apis ARSEF 7405]|uniref:G-patch domain containing protein n=1 Tax=Ascosphaera apis ARSEF 7405 TaxID=392613 RepID=A0A167YFV2_9EURO|nr:G-patch domain containing protein [Ascosphaera apis ARSEF 7405]